MGTASLLFCTDAEAKPFVRKVMRDVRAEEIDNDCIFYLVESHADPTSPQSFRRRLNDDEAFETEFVGASEQDCQRWALEKANQVNFIEHNLITIADKRSASDGTLLMQYHSQEEYATEIGRFGPLPGEYGWLNFRIDYRKACEVYTSLQYGSVEALIVYFGHKNELTNESGIFDVDRATALLNGVDSEILRS